MRDPVRSWEERVDEGGGDMSEMTQHTLSNVMGVSISDTP
jgi:hypothetical protein